MTSGLTADRPTDPDQVDPPKAQTRHYERWPRPDIAPMDHLVETVTSHLGAGAMVIRGANGPFETPADPGGCGETVAIG